MKTNSESINNVLKMNATSFFIPPFQRAYAWGKSEIERYFSDIRRIINSELNPDEKDKLEHFFGTIVIKPEEEGFNTKSIVVDGQQRLTTTLLFLIALRDLEDDIGLKNHIKDNYLTNQSSTFQEKIKLKQVTRDWEAYRALINNNEAEQGIIRNGYEKFKELILELRIRKPEITTKHYLNALSRVNVAIIFLDERPFKGEDPQIIFETLNSLGKPLSLSDLVRNYVLLKMKSDEQSDIYEKIWYPKIESVLKQSTSSFFRDFLQYKKAGAIKAIGDNNTKEIYQIFKEFVDENYKTHGEFVDDIVRFVRPYKWIVFEGCEDTISKDSDNNSQIKELLRNIFHDIKSEAFKPFVMGLLHCHQDSQSQYNDEMLLSDLNVIRTYLIRRRICKLAQGENKKIPELCDKSILDDIVNSKKPLIYFLSNLSYNLRLPNDDELDKNLQEMNFYEDVKKYGKFILGKIEDHNSKVSVDFRDKKITIEHIMPQTLSKVWHQELGEDYEKIHGKYLHNIGNLILTEFNTEMGNKSFVEKKQKLTESSLNYRLAILNCDNWNEVGLIQHRDKMIGDFLSTFSLPDEYRTKSNWNMKGLDQDIAEFSPLDDDAGEYAEGRKPSNLRIDDKNIKVDSWQAVFLGFLRYLCEDKKPCFQTVLENKGQLFSKDMVLVNWYELSDFMEENPDLATKYKTLDGKTYDKVANLEIDLLFVHVNISAKECMKRIGSIMEKLTMNADSVTITLQ